MADETERALRRRPLPGVVAEAGGAYMAKKRGASAQPAGDTAPELLRLAAAFAAWQKAARDARGWNVPETARATGFSDSQVRLYDAEFGGGFDSTGRYRRPSPAYVQAIASATGASERAGMVAAGLLEIEGGRVIAAGVPYTLIDPETGEPLETLLTDADVEFLLFRARRNKRA